MGNWFWVYRLRQRLRSLFRRDGVEQELHDEMQFHIEQRMDVEIAQGRSREEARAIALRAMDGIEQQKELCRDQRETQYIDQFLQDVRYAWRSMRKRPAVTLVILVSLALGIGSNTAIFSLVDVLLLRPLPGVTSPDRLVRLAGGSMSFPQFERLRELAVFKRTVAVTDDRFQADIAGSARMVNVTLASPEYFETLGVRAVLGRTLQPGEDKGQALVAVLDHRFWVDALGSDPNVIGRSIRVNQTAVEIVGVTGADFQGVMVGWRNDITVPITAAPLLRRERTDILTRRSAHWVNIMGQLKPGETIMQARARFEVEWPGLLEATAPTGTPANSNFFKRKVEVEAAGNGFSRLRRAYTSPLLVLMGLVGTVLLVACANVASLLIAQGSSRRQEFVIRQSMGAHRGRILRQLMTESLLLSVLGGIAGLMLVKPLTAYMVNAISTTSFQVWLDLGPDLRVLVFSLGVTTLAALLFGLAPAWSGSRLDLATGLKQSARSIAGGGHLRKVLLVGQIAMAMTLAVQAGLFANSLLRVMTVDLGFTPEQVYLVKADAVSAGYLGGRAGAFFEGLRERTAAIPGVTGVGLAWAPPVSQGFGNNGPVAAEGRPRAAGDDHVSWSNFVSPGYLETIGQTLVAGRDFSDFDRASTPCVVIVNQSLARHLFNNEDALGRRIDPDGGNKFRCEIVGVVRDAVHFDVKEKAQRVFYMPYAQSAGFVRNGNMILAIRSSQTSGTVQSQVREEISRLGDQILFEMEPLRTHVAASFARERLLAVLSGLVSALSVVLVAIGLYGVMAWSVSRRTAEIGIRIALGARPNSILNMVFGESLRLVLAGIGLGLIIAYLAGRAVESLLFGVTVRDGVTYAGAVVVMALVAVVATLLPAGRAARVDPVVALRNE